MEIIGLRIEKYIDKSVSGHNCDFDYKDDVFERHIIYGITSKGEKMEIILSQSEGECGSGWTTASYGNIGVSIVDNFGSFTHTPFTKLVVDDLDLDDDLEDINNDAFWFSECGGCQYYPAGGYSVNMSLFREGIRHKDERPVWLFKGKSNAGKSFLSCRLKGLDVYETDGWRELPRQIRADVIVLGNKYDFSIDDIKERIVGEHELQIVDFA